MLGDPSQEKTDFLEIHSGFVEETARTEDFYSRLGQGPGGSNRSGFHAFRSVSDTLSGNCSGE